MPPLPSDVREALGLDDREIPWVRLRSSLGSIVGETFVIAVGSATRVAMRTSALADLVELELGAPPRYEETSNDAAIVVSNAGSEGRIVVGYLERDVVRAFFEAPSARPASQSPLPPTLEETGLHPSPELDAARADLLAALRDRTLPVTLDEARGALCGLLATRLESRRSELTTKRAELLRGLPASELRLRAEAAIADIAERTPRLDARIGLLRKKQADFDDVLARGLFDDAIERARDDLANLPPSARAKRRLRAHEEPKRGTDRSWGGWVLVVAIVTAVVWELTRC